VEEHTATQFRAVGGGKYEPIPGTGVWKDVVDALSYRELADAKSKSIASYLVKSRPRN
jgi:hypothetical protein